MIGGIVAVAALTAFILFVIFYAHAGALHGSQFRLFAAAPDASNLRKGSEVWLNGQRVGTVRAIRFNQPTVPVEVRMVIELEVLDGVRSLIRLNSRAALQNAGSMIGEPVVFIESGTLAARAVVPGDTLRAAGNPDMEIAASKVTTALEQVPVLRADIGTLMTDAKAAGNRMRTIMAGSGSGTANRTLSANASALMSKLSGGHGSASHLMNDTELRSRVARSRASMDSVRQLLASRTDEFGRFRRDSTLAPAVKNLQLDVARLREMAAATEGTIGRMRADSTLRRGLDSVFLEMSALLADMKKHPLKYSHVF